MAGRVWRTFQGAVILGVVACLGMAMVLLVVGRSIDAHQKAKEIRLVEIGLERAKGHISDDLLAVTVWDEAVLKLSEPVDKAWLDQHVGPLYADQDGHVATLSYDQQGRVVRGSMDGQAMNLSSMTDFEAAARSTVQAVRAAAAHRDRSAVAKGAVVVDAGFVAVGGQIFQLAVSNVVRHSDHGPVPDADPLVASFKPFEAAVKPMGSVLGVQQPRFEPGPSAAEVQSRLAVVGVQDRDGRILGRLLWRPEAPGAQILARALPILAGLALAMMLAGLLLFQRIAADIRRLADSEAALGRALEQAQAASAAKSRFLANVSHELRTPLNGVLGMADVIERDLLTPQQRDRMVMLKASGRAQLRLIENLLLVTRLQSHAVSVTPTSFSPGRLLGDLVQAWTPEAAAKGLSLTLQPGAPPKWVADAGHLHRMVDALIDNALRVTETGGVTISARDQKGRLVIEVSDSGPGFDKERAARLLSPGPEEGEETDGAGLGLQIVGALAAMAGGTVEVDQAADVAGQPGGAMVRLILPRARSVA